MTYTKRMEAEPISDGDGCLFKLSLSGSDQHVFLTPSSFQRDIIVLTIQAFARQIGTDSRKQISR